MGFGRNLLGLVDEVAPDLAGTALDAGTMKADLLEKEERAAQANARQEEAKRVALEATAAMDEATDAFYRAASGYLDAIIGVVGKGSRAANNMARLRSRIRAAGDQSGEATTPGGTPPDAP